jgi:Fe-S-cluster containining protein
MNSEQQKREDQLSAGLCAAEHEAVVQILSLDRSPAGLMNVLNNATGFAETMAAKFRHPRTPRVDCSTGCDWCCYQTVAVTAPEAFAIAEFIRSADEVSQIETVSRLEDINRQSQKLTPRERTKQHIPCAFLREHQCAIYPVRPLACSEFTSMDVKDCQRAYRVGFKPKGIIHEKARMLTFNSIRQGMFDGLRESLPSSDPTYYELSAAVLAAMPEQAARQWLNGARIFENAAVTPDVPTGIHYDEDT